jgi:uracil DNA glycosylase
MNEEYLRIISELEEIKLVIMGKDPYPTNPNGIPFCKPTWNEQLAENSSGNIIFNSLGIVHINQELYLEPKDFFIELATQGVVFLNLIYEYLEGNKVRKNRHRILLADAFRINQPYLDITEHIVFCGEANKNRWNDVLYDNAIEAVHPDMRNRNSPVHRISENWLQFWSSNSLIVRFSLSLNI